MRGCRLLLLLLLGLPFSGISQTPAPVPREIVLQHLADVFGTPSKQEVAVKSIQAMGTNAIPLLIEILGYQPTQWEEWHEKAYAKVPPTVRNSMSQPETLEKFRHAASHLLRHMPETCLYATNLFPLLQDTRDVVRRPVATLFRHHAPNIDKALMLVGVSALQDPDEFVRVDMAYAFGHGAARLPRIRAAMEAALNDPVERVRQTVAYAMLKVDKNHEASLRTLKSLFTSSDEWIRHYSARYYLMSDPQQMRSEDELLPIFIRTLSSQNPTLQGSAAQSLATYGKRAAAAVPELKKLLASPDEGVRHTAGYALQRIADNEVLVPLKP